MTIKVGINGFGRIGRMVFRAIDKDFDKKLIHTVRGMGYVLKEQ